MEASILALDLGTITGWAVFNKNKTCSGTLKLKATRFQSADRRYFNFKLRLGELYAKYHFDVVYYEEVRKHIGVDAAHAYGGFKAILSDFCLQKEIPFEGVPVGTIKKFVTGKGNASKQLVIDAIRHKGHYPEDDNEADALAILYYAKNKEL